MSLKKIGAIAVGGAMVASALASGAMAATTSGDVAGFMKDTVKDGQPNVDIVVGSNAAAMDVVSAADIAAKIGAMCYKEIKDIELIEKQNITAENATIHGNETISISTENGEIKSINITTNSTDKIAGKYIIMEKDGALYLASDEITKSLAINETAEGILLKDILTSTDAYTALIIHNGTEYTVKKDDICVMNNIAVKVSDVYVNILKNKGYANLIIFKGIIKTENYTITNNTLTLIISPDNATKYGLNVSCEDGIISFINEVKLSELQQYELKEPIRIRSTLSTPIAKLDTEVSLNTADKNLILVGGPVVNALTKALVDAGQVAIDNESPAKLAVVEGAANNHDVLVVAGGNREATREAALDLIENY